MIEVLALAGMVTKVAGSISSAIKAGKDVNSIMPAFGKLANLESEINLAESGKHKGPLGRLTSSEEEAERRDKIFWVISVVAGVAVFAIGTGGLFWFAAIFASAHR